MSKGLLFQCIEDMEIVNLDINFYKNTLYTGIQQNNNIFMIDRNHNPIEIKNKDILNKHFQIK